MCLLIVAGPIVSTTDSLLETSFFRQVIQKILACVSEIYSTSPICLLLYHSTGARMSRDGNGLKSHVTTGEYNVVYS
jgi:hypothetical protein